VFVEERKLYVSYVYGNLERSIHGGNKGTKGEGGKKKMRG